MVSQKILIADGNFEFGPLLADLLQHQNDVRLCYDGAEALTLLKSFQPQVLVLDLMLPGLDGITLLHSAVSAGLCPMVLALSDFVNPYISETLLSFGVEYLMRKPCDLQAVYDRVQDLKLRIHKVQPPRDLKMELTERLVAMGFSVNLDGFRYLRDAILITLERPDISITKELYPLLERRYKRSYDHIERAMRNALEVTWDNPAGSENRPRFPSRKNKKKLRPANQEFIVRMADILRMEQEANNHK